MSPSSCFAKIRAQQPTLPPLGTFTLAVLVALTGMTEAEENWKKFSGVAGTDGWKCHTIQPDPNNHGPDGINLHDWDNDGHLDVFSNAEEGGFSRLYFNPGPAKVRSVWTQYIEFMHGPCEDSGIGDLDDDGDIDYIANGGWIFFNPGSNDVRDVAKWSRMNLFDHERRVPTVVDIDGDGLKDLVVGAWEWFRQPKTGKHEASNWKKFIIGKNRWPMNCHFTDIDFDGDQDLVVPDRGVEICWYENPGSHRIQGPWKRHQLHRHDEPMFIAIDDLNGDKLDDVVITGGSKGEFARQLIVLLRTNRNAVPSFTEITIDQASGNFPKGITVLRPNHAPEPPRILVIPKSGDLWTASLSEIDHEQWRTEVIRLPGSKTRLKMDNAWQGDLDGDGDPDIITTEENGGWGVIWFENPSNPKDPKP